MAFVKQLKPTMINDGIGNVYLNRMKVEAWDLHNGKVGLVAKTAGGGYLFDDYGSKCKAEITMEEYKDKFNEYGLQCLLSALYKCGIDCYDKKEEDEDNYEEDDFDDED
jgi:hypothetical protein